MTFTMRIYRHKGSSKHKHVPMHVCMRQYNYSDVHSFIRGIWDSCTTYD